ncbi:hypothetical protein [Streptosporangium longisporum]
MHQITADVQPYYLDRGEVLVSVWVGLVVRCDGHHYQWDAPQSRRRKHGWRTTSERRPGRAAKRLAAHYAMLRRQTMTTLVREGSLLSSVLLDQLLNEGHWQVHPPPSGDPADSSPAAGSPQDLPFRVTPGLPPMAPRGHTLTREGADDRAS